MGRSAWRSRSCRTCLMRKVKCDKTRPECIRCHVSKVHCRGYPQYTLPRMQHGMVNEEQLLAARQYQEQLLSTFLRDYLPTKWSGTQTYMTSVSWAEILPSLIDSKSTIIDSSVYALTLTHAAISQHDNYLLAISRQYHTQTIQEICAYQHVRNPHEFIHVAMILAMYELYTCVPGDIQSWVVHVKAACDFANQCHSLEQSLTGHDLCRLQTIAFLAACADRRQVSLSETLHPTPSNAYDQLLDILFKIPSIVEELEQLKSQSNTTICLRRVSSLLLNAFHIEENLMQWYQKLNTNFGDNEPLFATQPTTSVPNELHVTNGRITFRNESLIPLLLLYWLGLVIIYTTITTALQISDTVEWSPFAMGQSTTLSYSSCTLRESHGNWLQDSIACNFTSSLGHQDIDKQSALIGARIRRSHYAQRISDSMLDCANKSFGTAIVATLTSYVMHQFCSSPADDLAYVFEVFGRRGLKFPSV